MTSPRISVRLGGLLFLAVTLTLSPAAFGQGDRKPRPGDADGPRVIDGVKPVKPTRRSPINRLSPDRMTDEQKAGIKRLAAARSIEITAAEKKQFAAATKLLAKYAEQGEAKAKRDRGIQALRAQSIELADDVKSGKLKGEEAENRFIAMSERGKKTTASFREGAEELGEDVLDALAKLFGLPDLRAKKGAVIYTGEVRRGRAEPGDGVLVIRPPFSEPPFFDQTGWNFVSMEPESYVDTGYIGVRMKAMFGQGARIESSVADLFHVSDVTERIRVTAMFDYAAGLSTVNLGPGITFSTSYLFLRVQPLRSEDDLGHERAKTVRMLVLPIPSQVETEVARKKSVTFEMPVEPGMEYRIEAGARLTGIAGGYAFVNGWERVKVEEFYIEPIAAD